LTLSEIRAAVYRKLDSDSSSLRFPSATIDQFINDGYAYMATRSFCLMASTTLTPVAGQLIYDLPTDCVRVMRVFRSDSAEMVWPVDLQRLDHKWPNWESATGTRFQWYFLLGLDRIVIGPAISSVGSQSYSILYAQVPADLSDDDDVPAIPREYHEDLQDYATARALLLDGAQEWLEKATRYLGDFQKATMKLKRQTGKNMDRVHQMRPEDSRYGDISVDGPAVTPWL